MSPINPRSSRRTAAEQASINAKWKEIRKSFSGGGRSIPERGARVDTRRPAMPGLPKEAGFAPGQGAELQRRLETVPKPSLAPPPGGGWKDPSRGAPPRPPQGQPSAGRPTPPPSSQVSGAPTPRYVPRPEDGAMVPIAPQMPGNPFTPGFGSPAEVGFSRENLARSLAGEDWTNKGVVQQAGQVAGEIAFNEKVNNPFANAQFGQLASGPSLLSPAQRSMPPGFQMAGSLLDTQPQAQPLTGQLFNAAGGVPNAYGSPDVVQASLTTPEPVAPEAAAQSMASDAVNQVMSLQNRIRENRGMPLIVE